MAIRQKHCLSLDEALKAVHTLHGEDGGHDIEKILAAL